VLFAVNILDDVIFLEEVDGDKFESSFSNIYLYLIKILESGSFTFLFRSFIKFSNDLKGLKVRNKSLYNLA
jgi:hypothetical protein